MKNILGHRAWNMEEVVGMLRDHGSFTMCTLPHYRFDRVKRICRELETRGFIRRTGRTETSINFTVSDQFKAWAAEFATGATKSWPVKWVKAQKKTLTPGAPDAK